ncbi:sigma-70 family RNA polymerase sigma factor (plasmid) [Alicyclobacillus sp. TC]|uniref:sigma-70 family RNA polymerase sigma factor n=1 Tax=Alicyclobacillus sp. TC TaxID=2606450 RepID=UPI001932ED57|nr:sigma-70 family RNA polymerase sigma factor [Alicyclobacillus sp. TC]QRF24943.1 sigma-70 family RNA polymerase sigma factor [Alicyclobacillus sp. TC]
MTTYTPEQEVAWIRKIIRHAMLDEYRKWKRWNREVLILNAPVDMENGEERIEQIPDPASMAWEEKIALREILTHLPPREQQVLQALYDEGRTQREVAEQLGMSQMMVSKIHRQAIQHIRERLLS